jgi:phosphatidate cytidylyltransferase
MGRQGGAVWIALTGVLWWVLAAYLVWRYQRRGQVDVGGVFRRALAGGLVLVPAWAAAVALHGSPGAGPWILVYLLAVVWCADTAAFFVGRRWGRRRLASRVSPGKSWEGAAGALVCLVPLALACAGPLGMHGADRMAFVLLTLASAVVSILGDLTESLYKRLAGLKDSGGLLPGHGGVLDRIDSLTAAAPLFFLGFSWLER